MLLTKLYRPKTKQNLVYRHGLAEKLDKAKNKKLVLVSAPAGYGKTTLVSQWIEKNKLNFTWYSLDNSDNESTEFLNYLITAIQTIKKDFGQNALNLLNSPNSVQIESVITLLINSLLEFEDELFIVLDDIHVINQKEVFDAINFLLDHLPQNVHLIILTRSDPPLSTSRLRSQNELLEIRISDLSFSPNEIAAFFNKKLKLGLSDSDIYSLESKTEGWIAGLQLAALSMQGIYDKTGFIKTLAGSNRYIMDYLIEEVLRKQPLEVHEFLLKTAFLKQISAPLCNTILNRDDSQLILEELDRNNMFVIPLDNERKWYRYHHLFADLLKQRLVLEYKTETENLHKRASIWLEENGFFDIAIEHSLAINDYKKSIQIIGKNVETMWKKGKHAAILTYGNSLPNDLIKENPEFCLYYSWILISGGETQKAHPFLESAMNLVQKTIDNENLPNSQLSQNNSDIKYLKKLYGKVAVALAYLYSHNEGSEKTLLFCKIGLDNLPENDVIWHSWGWFTYGLAYFTDNKIKESAKALNTAFNYAQTTDNVYLISTILSRLAEIEQQLGLFESAYNRCVEFLSYMNEKGYSEVSKTDWTYAPLYYIIGVTDWGWAKLEKANDNLKIAYRLAKKGHDNFFNIYVSIVYSIVLNYQGDSEGEKIAVEVDRLIQETTVPPFLTSMYISSAMYRFLQKNQIEQAYNLLASYGIKNINDINYSYEMAYAAYARLLIHQHKLTEAESLLNKLYSYAVTNNEFERIIELNFTLAQLYELMGQRSKAVEKVMNVLEMSTSENQLFYFVFWAEELKSVFNEVFKIHATTKTNIPQKFIDKVQQAIKNEEERRNKKTESFLSEREMETLVLLNEDLTNQEIADKLFVSLNTIKTRLKNIYLKLEVDSRRKAVEKAKSNGLL